MVFKPWAHEAIGHNPWEKRSVLDVPKLESEAFKLLGNPFIHKMNVWNHSEHKIKDVIDDVPITYTEYKRSPNPFFADYLGGGLGLVTLQNRLHKARPVQSGRSRDCKLS